MKIWLQALRVNQWTKNAVVFAAWFFAVADASQAAMARGFRPFLLVCAMALSFSLISSAFYLLNDVADYDADRLHPVKRLRQREDRSSQGLRSHYQHDCSTDHPQKQEGCLVSTN